MRFIKSIFLSFTIWVLTALLNAIFSGSWLALFSIELKNWPTAFLVVLICTLVFSIPGMFIFWIVLLVRWNKDLLFRSLLQTGFIISALSSLLLFILPVNELKGQQAFLSLFIVIAVITSVMIHHSIIKSISKNIMTENDA
ncbi:MAG: hypothetical protein ABI707_05690 [Ferruginibacter sp.]